MRIFTLTTVFILAAFTVKAQDSCLDALLITAGVHVVDTIDGPEVPLPVCSSGGNDASAGEWFKYVANATYLVTVSSNFIDNLGRDTRFQVYSGECGSLICEGGDDDSGSGYLSEGNFIAEEGNTYYIAWDNRWDSNGFIFSVEEEEFVLPPVTFSNLPVPVEGSSYCVVDMNGDFLDDIVGVQSTNINIQVQLPEGGFEAQNFETDAAAYLPSWSIAAGDLDRNGFNDLLYGGGSGVSFMLRNEDGAGFTQVFQTQYVFSQRSNFIDINNDGHLDAFVCHDVEPNVYYLNDGEANLTFFQGGMGDTPDGGNYGSIWIDYDNDGDSDMFIAKCRGGNSPANINQLHRNNGDGSYTEIGVEAGLADAVQTWSSAWGDFDNDGFMDVLVGASSLSQGSHKLMYNNGDGTFTDITFNSGFDLVNATSIEYVAHDFDNDGLIDVMGHGNSIMFNNGDMTFTRVQTGFGNGPIGDLNNDGFLDVVNGNTIKINDGNDNNYLKINMLGTVSNINGIGARVELYSAMGKQIRDVRSGDGFRYMSTLNVHFGLGQDTEIDSLVVIWPSGNVDSFYSVDINSTFLAVEEEGETSPGGTTSVNDADKMELLVYPNPANDEIFITSNEILQNASIRIFDINGKLVISKQLTQNTVNISTLAKGAYVLQLSVNDKLTERRFVKQ
jgi:hypothetical protein